MGARASVAASGIVTVAGHRGDDQAVTPPFPAHELAAGDLLLFNRGTVFDRLINLKTWCFTASHVEVCIGDGQVVAARPGGVDVYPLDLAGLTYVLCPGEFNQPEAWRWFLADAKGQPYDWLGLLAFFSAKAQGDHRRAMFCSEFATRYLRHGGIEPFQPDIDADTIAPGTFLLSPRLRRIWTAPRRRP